MKIYYVNLEDGITHTKQSKKKLQSRCGRFIAEYVAKNYYGVENTEIILENGKPKFKFSKLNFNISHSENIVACAFDDYPVGIDVEYMKKRNFDELSKYLKVDFKEKNDFYRYWTQYEAKIKLQSEIKQILTFEILKGYMCSLLSSNPCSGIKIKLKIYELKSPVESIIPIELISLNPVNANNANENTLVAHERNIASDEFFTSLTLKTE